MFRASSRWPIAARSAARSSFTTGPTTFQPTVIFIVGHILVPAALYTEIHFAPSYWMHLALWLPAVLILTFGLLQPVKGVIVALQWTLGLHGFEFAKKERCSPSRAA